MTNTNEKFIYMFYIFYIISVIVVVYGIYYYSSSPQEELSQQSNEEPEIVVVDKLENKKIYNTCVENVSNNDGSYNYKDLNECLSSNGYDTPTGTAISRKVIHPQATRKDRKRFKNNAKKNANHRMYEERINEIIHNRCYSDTIRYSDAITYLNEFDRCLENEGYNFNIK